MNFYQEENMRIDKIESNVEYTMNEIFISFWSQILIFEIKKF